MDKTDAGISGLYIREITQYIKWLVCNTTVPDAMDWGSAL